MPTNPKGTVLVKIIVTLAAVALTGVFAGAIVACIVGLICGTGGGNEGGGGGGGGASGPVGSVCTSAPNACGQTSTGFVVSSCSTQPSGAGGISSSCTSSCNASVPSNSSCPTPTIPPNGFVAAPSTVGVNGESTLSWTTSNTTACTISGDNGFSASGTGSGSVTTGALSQTTTFTLTCSDGEGGPTASKGIKVIVDPHYREI